jgi:mycothiol synthase
MASRNQPAVTIRPFVAGADEALLADIYNRAHAPDPGFTPAIVEDFREAGSSPRTLHHAFLVAELGGVPAGYASVWVDASGRDGVGFIRGVHVVSEQQRRGVGTALVEAACADLAAHGQVAAHTNGPDRADINGFAESLGFRPVRRFSEMERLLTDLPHGVGESSDAAIDFAEITPETIPVLVELENESFKEHFNRAPETVEGFKFAVGNLARKGIFWLERIATVDDKPVGFCCYGYDPREVAALGRNRAGLWDVGVLKPYRNRGIAKALMIAAMRDLKERGMDEVELGVDETNVTGAIRVYERLGFRVFKRTISWRRSLAAR